MTLKDLKKKVRKLLKKENVYKVIVVVSGLALVATSILPYIIR